MWKPSVRIPRASQRPPTASIACVACIHASRPSSANHFPSSVGQSARQRRYFHEYFITHLPSTSLHPDSGPQNGAHHRLPRDQSTPYTLQGSSRSPAAVVGASREMTVVRIPLKRAKHHFGVMLSRGTRPYNEDAFQAGTIEVPAFAKRRPTSLTRNSKGEFANAVTPADSASGDPQVFYFGVFDGHGGAECSGFLREELHKYLEDASQLFELESSLPKQTPNRPTSMDDPNDASSKIRRQKDKDSLNAIETHTPPGVEPLKPPKSGSEEQLPPGGSKTAGKPVDSDPHIKQSQSIQKAVDLERQVVRDWKELVGGYFRRFKPEYFSKSAGGQGHPTDEGVTGDESASDDATTGIGIETVLQYAFLKADYDFVAAQVGKQEEDAVRADKALNDDDILGHPSRTTHQIGGPKRFLGGSTCSIALISTPTPSPYWHPSSPSSLITAHVGDTRILLCDTATGLAVPLTSNHHPSLPEEATRLRRYAGAFVTDSFGEERISGLANTRAFGDMASKRVGVSAEPEVRRIELSPAEYSFVVLCSDGVSGHLSDQEIVDVVKEARTPEQGARDLVSFAVETSTGSEGADNATGLVVRLGGWERRGEGGLGSMGTKEMRDWRKQEAEDPRAGRRFT
ncbi:protein phosphatase-like protein 2c [Dothidotthia symphoricarpi CBS 119687]|uniref:Protein phosphatase-like protein 2c n=1 Tax=Dothidotthia symphoricarpi CBS 119687 TaxID=1392245 RepID=A0A6A6A0W2_9PLEO|nr:protein phosphatase-like protein 2c [Dothidotthia symphoricarpi CBS 119687]KAF2124793.1 protein phosphatase-like protein 2c [Dothidotthia symphoricarpi CBS 119687]